jgi:hypothetical protein
VCVVLRTDGVGSETLLEGRLSVRSRYGRSSMVGVLRGWGTAEGNGEGCDREASKNGEKSLGTAVSEQEGPAPTPSSGVAGMEEEAWSASRHWNW